MVVLCSKAGPDYATVRQPYADRTLNLRQKGLKPIIEPDDLVPRKKVAGLDCLPVVPHLALGEAECAGGA